LEPLLGSGGFAREPGMTERAEPGAHPRVQVQDEPERWPVHGRTVRFTGPVFSTVTDLVQMPDGSTAERDLVLRPGAVAALPYDQATDRILLIRQYRHPAGMALWELPAGLCDVPGEPPLRTAERELYEEAQLRATDWRTLLRVYLSPGLTDETLIIYLARGLSEVEAADRHIGEHEEAVLQLAGRLGNPGTVAGVLALTVALAAPEGLDALASG
jgi:ADP-ribose pyrophosphatase